MNKEKLISIAIDTASRAVGTFIGVFVAGLLFWVALEIRLEVARQRLQATVNQGLQDAFKKK